MLRRDHVAGGVFVAAGALVLVVSQDLPFGTLASPGSGMLPTLVIVLMMTFGLLLVAGGGNSPPLREVDWTDLPHAARVVAASAAAIALYQALGFLVTMALLLFVLTFVVERKPLAPALLFSCGVTALAYSLFNNLLKAPLPHGDWLYAIGPSLPRWLW